MKYTRLAFPVALTALLALTACSDNTPPSTFDGTWQSDNFKKVIVIKLQPPRACEIQLTSDPEAQIIPCLYEINGDRISLHMEIETLRLEYVKASDTLTWAGPPAVRLTRVRP